MPVTVKFSRKFYDKLGDDVAKKLVEWFNLVDATYRSGLRELNELNFARFDAKLEQRVAQLEAKINEGFARADARLEQRIAEVKAELADRLAALEARLSHRLLGFWIAQAATTVGLVFGVMKLLQP
jgi:BMFP domain-containing protein YqiC